MKGATVALSGLLVLLGCVVIARAVQAGIGGGLGLLLGALLVAAGAARVYMARRL